MLKLTTGSNTKSYTVTRDLTLYSTRPGQNRWPVTRNEVPSLALGSLSTTDEFLISLGLRLLRTRYRGGQGAMVP